MTDVYLGLRRIGINSVNIEILVTINIICITFVDRFIYQTRDLMDLILPSLPKTDLTIVMMGTNDVRLGRGGTAMDNIRQINKI